MVDGLGFFFGVLACCVAMFFIGAALNGKGDWSTVAPDNTSITAIKIQTDKLAFTVANQVDANIKSVNDLAVDGSGTTGDPWGPV